MAELWDNMSMAIEEIKAFIMSFYEITTMIFNYIPDPFSTILKVAIIIIVALTALKVVRG